MTNSKTAGFFLGVVSFLVIPLIGCNSTPAISTPSDASALTTDIPTPSAASGLTTGLSTPSATSGLASIVSTPLATPGLTSPKPVLGYIDSTPALFFQPESGLGVDISNAIYSPETGALIGYKAKINYPSGVASILEFHDIIFNPSTGLVDAYKVLMEGNDLQGPTREEYETQKSDLTSVIAFSVNSFAGTEPLPIVSVPCQGKSNVEYGQSEGHRLVLRHAVTCSNQTYSMQYSNYVFDNQLGTLIGYSVLIEITH